MAELLAIFSSVTNWQYKTFLEIENCSRLHFYYHLISIFRSSWNIEEHKDDLLHKCKVISFKIKPSIIHFLPKFNDKCCSKQKSHGLTGHDATQKVKCYLWNDGQKSTTSETKMRAT